jgi:hemerythrin
MELEWQPDYETGNEYVDLQHRYFVDLINRVGINFGHVKLPGLPNDALF